MKGLVLFSLFVFLSAAAGGVCGQERETVRHRITGMVVDENERAVGRATVCASRNGPWVGPQPCATSNAGGKFSIAIQDVGTYRVSAQQLERGYPEPICLFQGPGWQSLTQVNISETSNPDPVKIKFARKAGRLVLTVLDGATRKPIEKGTVFLNRPDQPSSWCTIHTSWPKGHYEILTPDGPFTIKFQTWPGQVDRKAFDEAGLPVEVVSVDLGARKKITIRLN